MVLAYFSPRFPIKFFKTLLMIHLSTIQDRLELPIKQVFKNVMISWRFITRNQ